MADIVPHPELAHSLDTLLTAATRVQGKAPPPVESWNPPFCGDIDMRIARDGTWHYLGTPIGRPALVKLFASILRKDAEGYRLVTPVEKVGITVEDAPFLAVEMRVSEGARGQVLQFRTNVDDWVEAGADHALRFEAGASEGIKPYVHVRGGLWALVTRAVFFDLVDLGEAVPGEALFCISSGGVRFDVARGSDVAALA